MTKEPAKIRANELGIKLFNELGFPADVETVIGLMNLSISLALQLGISRQAIIQDMEDGIKELRTNSPLSKYIAKLCPDCKGYGYHLTSDGFFTVKRDCKTCFGNGYLE